MLGDGGVLGLTDNDVAEVPVSPRGTWRSLDNEPADTERNQQNR